MSREIFLENLGASLFRTLHFRENCRKMWGISSAHREMLKVEKAADRAPVIEERPPGLQHVLTVLVFWSWVLLLPRLPPWSRSLRLFPWASILLYGLLDSCLDLLPAAPPPVQKWDAQHMFLQHRGAHAEVKANLPRTLGPHYPGPCAHLPCGMFQTAHETTTATKLRLSSVPVRPTEVPK